MRKFPLPTVITAGILVLVLLAYAVVFKVRFNEVALRVFLGQADDKSVVTEAGPHFQWPLLESVQHYDKRLQVLDTPEGETKTRDGKNLIVGTYAIWRIENPLQYYKVVTTEAKAEDKIRARVNEARQTVIGRHDMSDFVALDPDKIRDSYDAMEKEMLDVIAAAMVRDYGIHIDSVGVRRISVPETVTQEVFKSMAQERDKTATTYREQGKSLKQAIEARADAAANKILEFAKRKAKEIESEGGRASRPYLEQIEKQDVDFFIFLRQMETLAALLKENTTIFFDVDTELFKRFIQPNVGKTQLSPAQPEGRP